MKKILISLKPDVYNRILSGDKIYEHRRVFPNDNIIAYIYVSKPIQKITGIMYLSNKKHLSEWKKQYEYDSAAIKRIDMYLKKYNVVMEINKFQETTSVSLAEIKKTFPKFCIPQMYYYLDDSKLLSFIEQKLVPIGQPIIHTFDNITSNDICR